MRLIPREILERIRASLLEAASHAYEEAGMQGLCAEGRWDAAIDAIRSVDLTLTADDSPKEPTPPAAHE